jgi:ferredoxin
MEANPPPSHTITVHWRQEGRVIRHQVLPFSCRNGCCTACAVRVLSGSIDQHEALGLSRELRSRGYGLLCVARAFGPLEVETQDEDEVYELQFGRHFGRGRVRPGLPLEEE